MEIINSVIASIVNQIGALHSAETILFDISIVLIISAFFALIAKMLRQPLIPAYVLAGLVIGPLALGYVKNMEVISAFSEIGIAFLLFVAGLEISFKKIKEADFKKILYIGFFQVVIIFFIVFFLRNFLELNALQSAYIGIILAFGSTMVDIKLLSDSGEIVTLHGRLIIGILLFQDLVAIVAIVLLTVGGFAFMPLVYSFLKLFGIIIFAILFQKFILNKIFRFAAYSTELLFLSSLAVLFLYVVLSYIADLSIVIGAFIAGVTLANSPFKIELESRIIPLRDFFAILFFVALGMQVVFFGVWNRIILFSALIIGAFIIKPLITLFLLRSVGYQPKTSFSTAISLGQLSEFSLIIGIIGLSLGVLDESMFSSIVLATIITMSATPYFINYKDQLYGLFKYPLKAMKFLPLKENLEFGNIESNEILLIGAHRMGGVLMKKFMKEKSKLLVIDYNPEIITYISKKNIPCIYGDITSPEIFKKINIKELKTVISTIPGFTDNLKILKIVKRFNPKARVIVTGARISETVKLYEEGANYVITPKILAAQELSRAIDSQDKTLKKLKREHLKHLEEIHNIFY